jgi:hypothetical protein
MNNPKKFVGTGTLLAALLILMGSFSSAQQKTNTTGESFFIISSINQPKMEILLKRPTEVTLLMHVSDKTTYLNETGNPIHLTDLRAGDTVWVTSAQDRGGEPTALRIRKGPMTEAELHRYYLDY